MITFRNETHQDYAPLYSFIKKAFETAQVSSGDEQDFVDKLRTKAHRYLPTLTLVAEQAHKIIGHIMLTRFSVSNLQNPVQALLLAPLSVDINHRYQGVGSKLVTKSIEEAKAQGFQAIFVVGDPDYYSRFGFQHTHCFNIKNSDNIPDQYVMVLELTPNVLAATSGDITFST